jgi:hypothetical protein
MFSLVWGAFLATFLVYITGASFLHAQSHIITSPHGHPMHAWWFTLQCCGLNPPSTRVPTAMHSQADLCTALSATPCVSDMAHSMCHTLPLAHGFHALDQVLRQGRYTSHVASNPPTNSQHACVCPRNTYISLIISNHTTHRGLLSSPSFSATYCVHLLWQGTSLLQKQKQLNINMCWLQHTLGKAETEQQVNPTVYKEH